MAGNTAKAMEMLDDDGRRPLEWLLVYSIERNGGIDDDWLAASGLTKAQATKLLEEHPGYREEARRLQGLGRLFTLEMLFGLLRERAAEMLAGATRPAELRSLLGILRQLPAEQGDGNTRRELADAPGRDELVRKFTQKANGMLAKEGLNRQQRRKLEKQLARLNGS